MNETVITRLRSINDEYIPRFIGGAYEHTPQTALSTGQSLSKCGLEWYDLAAANILLHRHPDITYRLSANLAEMVSALAYEGCVKMKIFTTTGHAKAFCNALALHQLPEGMLVYDFLLWMESYKETNLPCWMPYVMLLFAFTDTDRFPHHPYRSRNLVGAIQNWGITKTSHVHLHELNFDEFRMKTKLQRLIATITKDARYATHAYQGYAVDSIRILATAFLAISTIIDKAVMWPQFTVISREVLSHILREQQSIVDEHYKQHAKGETCEPTKGELKSHS